MKRTRAIAVFGTGSDVGKSIVAAALCRSFADRGIRVAPFKAQNMSNNSGITPEGLEMGRAQIVQAEASGIAPHVYMNPVLLKPTGDMGSQVVLNGIAERNSTAAEYHRSKDVYFRTACQAYDHISQNHDLMILEGAGSCAEVNLMPSDIVNFRMAEHADADVILVADIHRGGVFAQIVGTLACLPEACRDRIKGFIINRFRGDISLFKDGVDWIETETGKPVFGVLPWYSHFKIDAEDSVEIEQSTPLSSLDKTRPAIAVIRLRHISNFTDIHPLSTLPGLQVAFVESPMDLTRFSAVIIPGSKNTRSDIAWLKESGWQPQIARYEASGGHVLGICGGYQILGSDVADPDGIEGSPGVSQGLGLLPVSTILKAPKTTTISDFAWNGASGRGYEIHMGLTERTAGRPWFKVLARNRSACQDTDGCISDSGRVAGTYLHGLFDSPDILIAWLKAIGIYDAVGAEPEKMPGKEAGYNLLKEHFERHINMAAIERLAGPLF